MPQHGLNLIGVIMPEDEPNWVLGSRIASRGALEQELWLKRYQVLCEAPEFEVPGLGTSFCREGAAALQQFGHCAESYPFIMLAYVNCLLHPQFDSENILQR